MWAGLVPGVPQVGQYVVIRLDGTASLNPHSSSRLRAGYAHLQEGSIPVLIRNSGQNPSNATVTVNSRIGNSGTTGGDDGRTGRVPEHLCFRIMTRTNSIVPRNDYSDSVNPLQFFSMVVFTHVDFPNDMNWGGTRAPSLGAFRRNRTNASLTNGTFNFILHPQ
jgi:hypothetical protein